MKRKLYRFAACLMALCLIGSALAGCAAPTPAAPAAVQPAGPTSAPATEVPPTATSLPPTPTKEPVKLSVWIMDRVGANALADTRKMIEQWAAETGNQVEITEGAQFEMMNKIPTAIPAGEGPDVFMNINSYLGQHLTGKLIVPIDDALTAEEKAKYTQGALDAFTLDGQLLGIPLVADVNALVYNKDLLPEPPKTMEELITKAKELTQNGQYGLLYTVDQFWYDYPFFSAYGGYVFKQTDQGLDPKDVGFDNEGAVQGLTYARDLVTVHKLMPADVTWDVMNSMFSTGQAAMTITNPSMIPAYKEAGINIGVARIPVMENGKYPHPFATYTGFTVSAYSQHQEEAKALAAYLGANLPVPLFKANTGNIPVYKDAISNADLAANEELAGWMSQLEESDPLPSINEMNFVWGPATTAFQTVVQGKATPAEALKAAQEQILKSIAEAQ